MLHSHGSHSHLHAYNPLVVHLLEINKAKKVEARLKWQASCDLKEIDLSHFLHAASIYMFDVIHCSFKSQVVAELG
jgi:hypothetical protein